MPDTFCIRQYDYIGTLFFRKRKGNMYTRMVIMTDWKISSVIQQRLFFF